MVPTCICNDDRPPDRARLVPAPRRSLRAPRRENVVVPRRRGRERRRPLRRRNAAPPAQAGHRRPRTRRYFHSYDNNVERPLQPFCSLPSAFRPAPRGRRHHAAHRLRRPRVLAPESEGDRARATDRRPVLPAADRAQPAQRLSAARAARRGDGDDVRARRRRPPHPGNVRDVRHRARLRDPTPLRRMVLARNRRLVRRAPALSSGDRKRRRRRALGGMRHSAGRLRRLRALRAHRRPRRRALRLVARVPRSHQTRRPAVRAGLLPRRRLRLSQTRRAFGNPVRDCARVSLRLARAHPIDRRSEPLCALHAFAAAHRLHRRSHSRVSALVRFSLDRGRAGDRLAGRQTRLASARARPGRDRADARALSHRLHRHRLDDRGAGARHRDAPAVAFHRAGALSRRRGAARDTIARVRAIAGAFVASRAIVLALLILFGNLQLVRTTFVFVKETRITLRSEPLVDVFSGGDAKWFRIIAEDGYVRAPFHTGMQVNWAFFPLYPMATRYLRVLPSYALNATILTHLFFLGALLMLHRLARATGFDERAVMYMAFFPTSYFFSLPMSESLFVLLAAGCCVAAFA